VHIIRIVIVEAPRQVDVHLPRAVNVMAPRRPIVGLRIGLMVLVAVLLQIVAPRKSHHATAVVPASRPLLVAGRLTGHDRLLVAKVQIQVHPHDNRAAGLRLVTLTILGRVILYPGVEEVP
jgi:hypothetical protein